MSTTKNVALDAVKENPANTVTVKPSMGPNDFMSKVRMGTESLFKVTPVAQKSYSKAFAELGLSTSGNAAIDNAIGALAVTLKEDAKNQVRIAAMLAYIDGNELFKRFHDVNGNSFRSMKAFLTSGKMEQLTGGESAYSTLQNLLNVGASFYLPYYAGDERYAVFTEISPSKLVSLVSLAKQESYKGFLDAVFTGKKFALVGKTLPEMTVREIQKVAASLKPKKQERKTGESRNAPETPKEETPAPETPKEETPAPETPKEETPAPETPMPDYVIFKVVMNDGKSPCFMMPVFESEIDVLAPEMGVLMYKIAGDIHNMCAFFVANDDATHTRAFVGEFIPVSALNKGKELVQVRRNTPMSEVKDGFRAFIKSL